MKRFAKGIALLFTLCAMLITGGPDIQYFASPKNNTAIAEDGSTITPFSDILEWRYKVEDGKLYRRLYNRSRNVWIGEWELY